MAEFKYFDPTPLAKDSTQYRLLTKDFVSVERFGDRQVLKVKPEALRLLSEQAFHDIMHFLHEPHLKSLAGFCRS